jgi:hypothetical protein
MTRVPFVCAVISIWFGVAIAQTSNKSSRSFKASYATTPSSEGAARILSFTSNAASPDIYYLLAITPTPTSLSLQPSFSIIQINSAKQSIKKVRWGDIRLSIAKSKPLTEQNPSTPLFMTSDAHGNQIVLALLSTGMLEVDVMNINFDLSKTLLLDFGMAALVIRQFKPAQQDSFVVTGSSGLQPILLKFRIDGMILQKTGIKSLQGLGIASVSGKPGSDVVLIENQELSNESSVIAEIDSEGNILRQAIIMGKPLSLEKDTTGNYYVLVEQIHQGHSELFATLLDSGLRTIWGRSLTTCRTKFCNFTFVNAGDNGMFVLGNKENALWMATIEISGEMTWEHWMNPKLRPDLEMLIDFAPMQINGKITIGSSIFQVKDRTQYSAFKITTIEPD